MSRLWLLVPLVILTLPPALHADDELASQARTVLRRHCLRCHNGNGSEGGDFDILNITHLTEEYGLVTPETPEDSLLLERVVEETMPPYEIRQLSPVTAGESEILRRWIAAGAAPFPAGRGRDFIELVDVLTVVKDFLRTQRPEDRQFLRFFTLHNVYNNSKVLSEDLPIYRAALSKALNSLSNQPRIALPRAIDAREFLGSDRAGSLSSTVYVIDVRDYGWDEDTLWKEVIRAYPYGVSYDNLVDPQLQQLDEQVMRMTDSDMPLIRADWFIATATRPPLYHTLMRIPEHADTLERQLAVDIPGRFERPAGNALHGPASQRVESPDRTAWSNGRLPPTVPTGKATTSSRVASGESSRGSRSVRGTCSATGHILSTDRHSTMTGARSSGISPTVCRGTCLSMPKERGSTKGRSTWSAMR